MTIGTRLDCSGIPSAYHVLDDNAKVSGFREKKGEHLLSRLAGSKKTSVDYSVVL